jgi:HD superfamily phosphohydrolase
VHGYVSLSPLERVILDQPVSQRLRWVAQNGLAQLVYPSSVTARFSHSLGTMHLASRFLAAARRNSPSEISVALNRALIRYGRQRGTSERESRVWASYINSDALIAAGSEHDDVRHWWILAEQSLRLAAFFHDLGHLAFSHDFEYALRDYWAALQPKLRSNSPMRTLLENLDEPPHEVIGHRLAPTVLAVVEATHTVDEPRALAFVFEMAQAILEADFESPREPAEGAMRLLHLLIDGQVDADRCDYILRDARGFGFDFAAYDLDRLLDNLVVVVRSSTEAGRPLFDVAIRPQGVAAAERFFIARYRSYQYNTRHHKVAQVGAVLRYAIKRLLLNPPRPLRADMTKLLDLLGGVVDRPKRMALHATQDLLSRFARHDDMSWMGLMRRAYDLTPTDPWLALLCWRQPTVKSMWKRPSDFPVDDIREWNRRLDSKGDIERQRAWDLAVSRLETRGVLVLRHKFNAIGTTTYGEDTLQVADGRRLADLSAASSLLSQLKDAWMGDVQIHAAQPVSGSISAKEIVAALSL